MKPLQLVISAFGPFKDEVQIDFEKLGGQGLFLVSGDTGSGKTTIFDAISFALFGSPSGERRNEENNMALRSQYADKSTKTFVELTFLHKGQQYYIRRNPQYMRPSLRGTGETMESQGAELHYPDGRKVVDFRKVTKAVEDLLGINWAQYKQIAMIAQGEFLELLVAESDKRSAILRKIFGTGIYVNIQERLATATNRLRNECEAITNSIFLYLHDVQCPKENAHYEPIMHLVSNRSIHETETLLSEIKALVNEKKEEYSQMGIQYKEIEQQLIECRKRIAQAEQINAMYDSFTKAKEEEQRLLRNASVMEEKQTVLEQGSIALHHIKPLADSYRALVNEEASLTKKLTELKGEEVSLRKTISTLLEEKVNEEANQPIIEQLAATLIKRKEEEAKYQQIHTLQVQADNLGKTEEDLQQSLTKEKEKKTALEKSLEAGREQLTKLKEIEVIKATLEADVAAVQQKKQKAQAVYTQFTNILKEQQLLETEQSQLKLKVEQYRTKNDAYKEADLLYIKEQAGIMAENLMENAPCPVCGSTHHPDKAPLAEGALSKEELQALKEQVEAMHEVMQQASEACNTRANTLSYKKEMCTQAAKEFTLLEKLSFTEEDITLLENLMEEIDGKLEELHKAHEKAVADSKRKAELEENQQTIEEQIKTLQTDVETKEKQINELQQQSSAVRASLATLWKEVSFASVEELKAKEQLEEEQYTSLKKSLEEATSKYQETNAKFERIQAVIHDNTEQQASLQLRLREAKDDYCKALAVRGFALEEAYMAALRTEEELTSLQKELTAYRDNMTRVKQSLTELTKALQGRQRKDISTDKEEESQLDEKKTACGERMEEIRYQTNQNVAILKKVASAYAEHKGKTDEYAVYDRLSKTANGNLSGKAKIAFEQYVQAFYFDQILAAANERLRVMSNSQYELQRKEEATNLRKNTGLDIEVMDHYSGKARSVKTLSGGESFKAALSLALGLSDIIQSFAGGIEVDAMFVDEGFGSLDTNSLEQALSALNALTIGNRLVGIISHVNELKERIDKKILLSKSREGSELRLELS